MRAPCLLCICASLLVCAAPRRKRAAGWFTPKKGDSFIYAINDPYVPANATGAANQTLEEQILDVDLFNTNASTIAEYHQRGVRVVCYFSAGSWEPYRPDNGSFDPSCYKGDSPSSHQLKGFEDEYWFDTGSPSCIASVRKIQLQRIELAANKSCDAVDPDNIDGSENPTGWNITRQDSLNYINWLANNSHALGMGYALKNGGAYVSDPTSGPALVQLADLVVIEQCQQYNECSNYQGFVDANKLAVDIEYNPTIQCSSNFTGLQYHTQALSYANVVVECNNATPTSAPVSAVASSISVSMFGTASAANVAAAVQTQKSAADEKQFQPLTLRRVAASAAVVMALNML